jgi:uncharacterized surface protein with fasciclin (FAS1) repeats
MALATHGDPFSLPAVTLSTTDAAWFGRRWCILWKLKSMNRFPKAAVAGAVAVAVAATIATAASAQSIVDIAVGDERFSTRVAAVSAAGLVDKLAGPGPFTVFAPVNDAFAALPEGTVETLLLPENKRDLTNVLLYHVDDRNLTAEQIPAGSNYFKPISASKRMCIIKGTGGVSIADGTGGSANVIIANIKADNSVIHVTDKVLLPRTRPACH